MTTALKVDVMPLLGAALGDALGAGVEGAHALQRALGEEPHRIGRDFLPYSPFGFEPGELTDDTQMAWAAFCELRGGRPDVAAAAGRAEFRERVGLAYRRWFGSAPPDVGAATASSLLQGHAGGGWESWAGGESAGNGSLMRATAPFVAGYRGEALLAAAALDSALTHPDPRCVAACVWYAATLERLARSEAPEAAMTASLGALEGLDVDVVLAAGASSFPDSWTAFRSRWPSARAEVRGKVEAALRGGHVDCVSASVKDWPTGFVLSSLGQAAWAALQGDRADLPLRLAVLQGGRDADTIGAIAGGLIGARFGLAALDHWDADLVAALRLGHRWPGLPVEGRFVDLLTK